MPMGYKDAYATIHYYNTLHYMVLLEQEVASHPEWNMLGGPLRQEPEELLKHKKSKKMQVNSFRMIKQPVLSAALIWQLNWPKAVASWLPSRARPIGLNPATLIRTAGRTDCLPLHPTARANIPGGEK